MRQPRFNRFNEIRIPPSACPTTAARPNTAPYKLSASGFSDSGKIAWIDASACGAMIAAVTPCNARPTMSVHGELARPHSVEAIAKPINPRKNTRPRPNRSPNRPPVISVTAYRPAYDEMTSCSADDEAPSSARIDGSATLTMKKSSGGRNAPTSRTENIAQRRGSGETGSFRDMGGSPYGTNQFQIG